MGRKTGVSTAVSYVQQRGGDYFVGESEVTLRSVIATWKRVASPESIQESFPSLPLVAIYGAITYYLERQAILDANFQETDDLLTARQATVEAQRPEFFAEMRRRLAVRRALGDEDRQELNQG